MKIQYRSIILRDTIESDIDDQIRWCNVDTEWDQWDAPDEPTKPVEPESYRKETLEELNRPLPEIRHSFAMTTLDGTHIGSVTSYCIDEDYEWISRYRAEEKGLCRWAIGVDICESTYWGKGLGTMAVAAFCKYFLDSGRREIYTQTWSGNHRMIRCAQKLGFQECCRVVGDRRIRGGTYDSLTFRLDLDRFHKYLKENP